VLKVNNLCIKNILTVSPFGEKEGTFFATLSFLKEREQLLNKKG
jgi:hypothetical protein